VLTSFLCAKLFNGGDAHLDSELVKAGVSCPCRCTRPLARAGNRPCARAGGATPGQEQRPYECFAQTRGGLPPAQADLFGQTHQPLARPVEQLALIGNSPPSAARSYRSQHSRARRASSRPSGSQPPSSPATAP